MPDKKPKKYVPLVPPWVLGIFVLALLTVLVLLQTSNLWKGFAVETATDTLTLYALSTLNFVAFVIFAFIFFRSLLKLSRERRALELGSQLKTKLLKYFFAVSVMPIIAMAVFSYLYMNRAIERWLSAIPENAVRTADDMQGQAIRDQSRILNETARMLTLVLDKQEMTGAKLAEILRQGNLTRIEILSPSPGGAVLAESQKPLDPAQQEELNATLVFIRRDRFGEPALSDGEGFDAAAANFSDGRRLVIVPDYRSGSNVKQAYVKALADLDILKERQETVRLIGLSTLGLLTFLLIFASSWAALYVARGLTVPIKALAKGSDEIAHGNFAHRVDAPAEDELALLVTAFNEMSARLEANAGELRERRKYIETVLQSLSTGVISFDAGNRVTTINKAAVQMLRLEGADFKGFALADLTSAENLAILEKLLARARRIGQATEQTALTRENLDGGGASGKTDESLPVALTATALPNMTEGEVGAGGGPTGVVLVIEDLTELLNAQRASAWQEVARRMAHEIKNPLTPIQLSAERIAKRFAMRNGEGENGRRGQGETSGGTGAANGNSKTNESFASGEKPAANGGEQQLTKIIDESTTTILREVGSLKAMVDEFSRFARLPNVRLEPGSVNEVARQAEAVYEDRLGGARLEMELAENLPAAMIDEEQLRRVVVNLIENSMEAFDAAQADKKILVRTRHDEKRDLIALEVSDNGKGIAPQNFQKLFQPYFSTKGRGTGLGLAIVQRIVVEHGGKIRAAANQPKGAKFIIELPLIS